MKKLILLLLILVYVQSMPGESFDIVNIANGVRQNAIGNVFTGIADDVTSVIYNPAGLVNIREYELNIIHQVWMFDMHLENISYGKKIKNFSFGANLLLLHSFFSKEDSRVIENGFLKGKLNDYDLLVTVSGAIPLIKEEKFKLSLGLGIKYMENNFADYNKKAISFDAGTLFSFNFLKRKQRSAQLGRVQAIWDDLKVGVCLQNMGFGFYSKTGSKAHPKPILRVGFAFQPIRYFLIAADMNLKNIFSFSGSSGSLSDFLFETGVGLEVYPFRFVTLRAGYNLKSFTGLKSSQGTVTAGIGINFALYSTSYGIDYTFNYSRDAAITGMTHMFSISFSKNPGLMKWIIPKKIPYSEELKKFKDVIILKKAKKKETEKKKVKKVTINVSSFKSKDSFTTEKGYNKIITENLKSFLASDT